MHPTSLLNIPTELRIYIAECLAGESLKAFAATCKDLQSIAEMASKDKARLATDSVLLWFRNEQSRPRHFTQRELLDELKTTVDSAALKEYNALLSACRAGDLDTVRDLLKTISLIPPDLIWPKGRCPAVSWYTPVDQAVYSDSIETLDLLLAAGPDFTSISLHDMSRLLFGRRSWNRAMTDRLIDNGLDIHLPDALGDTLLNVLCRGCCHLPKSCIRSPLPAVKYLVDKGVDVEQRNYWGSSPLSIAIERSEHGAGTCPELFDLIRFLLESGSGVNAPCTDQEDNTALHVACEIKSRDIVNLLLDEFNADVEARNFSGETPLHIALEKNSGDICEILLQMGASLTTTIYRHGGKMNYLEYALDIGSVLRTFYDAWINFFGSGRPDLLLAAAAAIGDVPELERLLPLYEAGRDNAKYNVNVAFSQAVRYQREGAIEFLLPHVSSITAVNKKIARTPALQFADRLSDRTLLKIMARAPSSEIDAYVDNIRDGHFRANILIAMLLSGRAPTSIIAPNCQDLLEEAVTSHNMEAFRFLLKHVQLSDFNPGSIIRGALHYEFLEAVEYLQDSNMGPVITSRESNSLILSDAIRCSKAKALKFLIKAGADITANVICSHASQFDEAPEMQPFAVAVAIGRLPEIMQMLLAAKVDPNTKDTQYQLSLLSWASFYDDPHTVRSLISYGADVSSVDIFGRTALFYAATCGSPAIIRMLLEAGAQPDVTDNNQMTPLTFAAGAQTDRPSSQPEHEARDPIRELCIRHSGPRVYPAYMESAQLLLDAGGNAHHRDSSGRSPLSHAAQMGSSGLVQTFIDLGVDVDAVDDQGRTALSWACMFGQDTAMALVAAGCDVSRADYSGKTPLQYADYDKVDDSDAVVKCLYSGNGRY